MLRLLPRASLLPVALVLGVTAHAFDAAERDAIREQVRLGRVNPCIDERVAGDAARPVLVFHNHCDLRASVMLCLRVSGSAQPDYFNLLVAPDTEARQALQLRAGAQFAWRFNSCRGALCTAPRPEC